MVVRAAPGTTPPTNPKGATHIFLDGVGVLNAHHPLTHQHCLLLVAECLERGHQSQVSSPIQHCLPYSMYTGSRRSNLLL